MIDTTKQVKEITYNGTPLTLYQEEPKLQEKIINITENGSYTTVHSDGFDGLGRVDINVNVPIPEVEEPVLQSKMVDITSNGSLNITPDDGYDGLSSVAVTVNVAGSGGGPSLLDKYALVYEHSTGLTANNASYTAKTKLVNSGSTSYSYTYHLVLNTIPVGASIFDYLTTKTTSSGSRRTMALCTHKSDTTAPEINIDTIKSNGTYFVQKYNSVTYTSGGSSADYGNLIIFDNDGKCLFNGSLYDGYTALNNKTIDVSNGVALTMTEYDGGSGVSDASYVFK